LMVDFYKPRSSSGQVQCCDFSMFVHVASRICESLRRVQGEWDTGCSLA